MTDFHYQADLNLYEQFNEAFDRFMVGEHDEDDLKLIDSYPYPAKRPVRATEEA